MIYKQFQDKQLSALGLGCMRLPLLDEDTAHIDLERSMEMMDYAMEQGVNYYDTAWGYHSGQSEPVMGQLLSRYPRESFYLATKFPGYDPANMEKAAEIFEQQLERCQVEYFDFYLFHNVCEKNVDGYMDPRYGIFDYLMEQKKKGRVRHLGFSSHGSAALLRRFLEAYGHAMEFCQLQINYLDWDFQSAKEKVALLKEYNIPVWVMEPLRGGKLAKLSEEETAALAALRPEEGVPAWGFRFLQSIPEVVVTLSGMSNMEQLRDNIATFSQEKPLDDREMAQLMSIARDKIARTALPCTACRYCTPSCPMELDIPALLEGYNQRAFPDGGALSPLPQDRGPAACIGCRRCEQLCPQGIRISEVMKKLAEL